MVGGGIRKMTKNCVCEKQNCIKCRLQKYKIEVENQGMKLLTTLGTFQTSKKLYVVCVCGTEKYSSLNDIKRGKKCMKCKTRKYKETCIKKYGCENVFQNEEIKEKIRKTNREKLGVDYPQQNKEIKTKTNETCKKKYGYAYAFNQPEIYEKIRKTHIKNHGVPFPLQNKDIRKKGEETCIKNHGVPKYLLTYKSKDFVLPSGKTIKVQGYEDLTLKTLLTEKHKILKRSIEEDEIYTGNTIQSFPYVDRKGKFRRYYPDIFISSIYRFFKEINENLIIGELKKYECFIEVKSVYTLNQKPIMKNGKRLPKPDITSKYIFTIIKNYSTSGPSLKTWKNHPVV